VVSALWFIFAVAKQKPFDCCNIIQLYLVGKFGGAGVIRMVNAYQLQGVPEPKDEERPGGIASVCDAAKLFRTNTNLA